jgi:predicted nucleic acid-binding protein
MEAWTGERSMVGIDTGFFVGLMKGDSKPVEFWTSLADRDTLPVISMLTLGELLYISFRLGQPDKGKELVDSIDKSARVLPVDRPIIEKAASLKAGRGIPYIDSIILATFMLSGCREIHTNDRNHFAEIKNKDISFVFY